VDEGRPVTRRALPAALLLLAACGKEPATVGMDLGKKPSMTLPWTHEGLTVDAWLPRLRDDDPARRAEAAQALAQLGPEGAARAATLAPLLEDADPSVRWSALDALARIRPDDAALVAAMVARLSDPEPGVRRRARTAAADLGAAAVLPLVRRVEARDDPFGDALAALGSIGPAAAGAAPVLEAALTGPEWDGQERAARALSRLGAAGVDPLRRALRDDRGDVAAFAADGLGSMGALAAPALPDLAAALRRRGPPRFASAAALVSLRPASAAVLDAALADPDEAVRAAVSAALEEAR
jgi:HEAT repeat protein